MWSLLNLKSLGLQQALVSLMHYPCSFSQPDVMVLLFPGTGTQDWGAGVGLRPFPLPEISLPFLNLCTVGMGPAYSLSLPLLPVFMVS